jgi:hypothetical protein
MGASAAANPAFAIGPPHPELLRLCGGSGYAGAQPGDHGGRAAECPQLDGSRGCDDPRAAAIWASIAENPF